MGARPGGHTVWRRIRGESTVETGSPGSTSHLCEATLDPGPLPTADHRVVYRGPGFLLRLLAVRVQAPSNTTASTAALSRCLPKNKPAAAPATARNAAPRQTKKTTTTMTLTNWRSSGPKKSDDGRSHGLPEPGTLVTERLHRNERVGGKKKRQ